LVQVWSAPGRYGAENLNDLAPIAGRGPSALRRCLGDCLTAGVSMNPPATIVGIDGAVYVVIVLIRRLKSEERAARIQKDRIMGANHAGERKRKKLKNTKKIISTQAKKAASKAK
jgi:hypothetical protein